MTEVLLAHTIASENTWSRVDWEGLKLLLISGILGDNELGARELQEVELAAEDGGEDALNIIKKFKWILAILFIFVNAEIED